MNSKKIIKESIKVLIIGSLLSSFGGMSLELIRTKLTLFLPLVIVLPALTDMVGDAGTIVVSKITTYLYLGKFKKKLLTKFILDLFLLLLKIFSISAIYVTFLALFIGYIKEGFSFNFIFLLKMFLIILITTFTIISIIFSVALVGSRYAFRRNIDPDDLLIPITTAIADLGSLITFSLLVYFIL